MPKYNLEFQPEERRRRDQLTRFLLGFGAILLLLAVASTFALQRGGFIDDLFDRTTVPYEAEPDPDAWDYEGSATFLLAGYNASLQNLRFAILVQVELATQELYIIPLNPQALSRYRNQEVTLEQALRQGGMRALMAAAGDLTGAQIDRFVAANDAAFIRAVNNMGSVTVHLDSGIRFRGQDFSLTLAQGTQRLQGDMLLRYFRYLGTLDEDPPMQQGHLMQTVLETFLTPQSAGSLEALETRFGALSGILNSDISVADFFANRDIVLALLEQSDQITMQVRATYE